MRQNTNDMAETNSNNPNADILYKNNTVTGTGNIQLSNQNNNVAPSPPVVPNPNQVQLTDADVQRAQDGEHTLDILTGYLKPKPIDEKALSRNRTLGSIGDGIKLLGQMYAAGKGAHVQATNPKHTLTNYFLDDENKVRNLYEQHLDAYNRIRANTKKEV